MADQKTTLKVGLEVGKPDLSATEKAFNDLTKKLQSSMDKLKLSPAATKITPTGIDSVKEKRDNDVRINQYNQILKTVEKMISLEKELGREREKNNRQEHLAQIQKSTFAQVERNARIGIRGYKPPTFPEMGGGAESGGQPAFRYPEPKKMPKGGVTSLVGLAEFLGVPLAAIGAAATAVAAIKGGEMARRFVSESPLRARELEASAFQTQGQGGQRLQSFLSGGASEEILFNAQRNQAAQISKNAVDSRYSLSPFLKYSPIAQMPRLVYGDQALGAFQHGQFMQGFRALGGHLGSKGLQGEYEATKRQEQADLQAQQFEALKNGPAGAMRTAVGQKYLKDWRRNLDFQRQTGMSDSDFRTNYLGGIHSAGFTDEQGMGMSSGIQGAGGSTRAQRGSAGFALQMQRAFDLTNAGQAIGTISGQLGSAQMSKEALIKIQAEGTRIGVNQSEFREENRKFVEMASSIIGQSTATSGAGIDQLVTTLGRFMGTSTMTGLEAGRNAYSAYQQQSNTQSGASAVMRAGGMIKNPLLRKLSGDDQAALFTMSQADVNVDDKGIQAMANKIGVSPQALVEAYHGVQEKSTFTRKATDMSISKLKKAYKSGIGIQQAEGEAQNLIALEPAGQKLDRKGQLELARAMAKEGTPLSEASTAQIRAEASAGKTGRVGDEQEKVQAQASRLANELFNQIKDSIVPASNAAKMFAQDINELTMALSKGTVAQKQSALEKFNTNYPGITPTNQSSAGPPANGPGQGQ